MASPTDFFGISGKLVLVTGSTAGIGRGIAELYLKHGAHVLVNGRSEASVARVCSDLAGLGGRAIPCVGDASTKAGCDAVIAAVDAQDMPLHVLINNVGKFAVKPFAEITDDEWESYFETNIMSGVRLARRYLAKMLERDDHGRIVFISSEAGLRPLPHMVAYSMSKAAQISIANSLAQLTKGTTVTVNSVLPGPTWTEGVEVYIDDWAKANGYATRELAIKAYFASFETTSLLQRFATVEEVANVVLFVGSRAGAAINGAAQHAEGGILRVML